jgi:hypothetical protein
VLRRALLWSSIALVLASSVATRVAAQDEQALIGSGAGSANESEVEGTHHVSPPPPPETLPPEVTLEIRGAAIVPMFRDALCPANHECVFNAGVGVGVSVERRWSDGWGFLSRYDVWVLDAGSLYEIGTLHSVRIGARYVIDQATNVHPYLEALAGFLAFGDTTTVAAAGGSATAGVGTEIELTDVLVLDVDAELWALATGFFATRDGVRRSDGFGVNLALQVSVGLEVLLGAF